ncbi:hypothetical protein FQZ97_1042350 [compost metagenome]
MVQVFNGCLRSKAKRTLSTLSSAPSSQKQFSVKLVSFTPQDRFMPTRSPSARPDRQAQFQWVSGRM